MRPDQADAPSEPNAPSEPPEGISFEAQRDGQAQVQALRRRLLDLRTVTRLIHFPHAERSKGHVRVVDDVPERLHQKLMDGRSLRILPLPATLAEPERDGEAAPADEPSAVEELVADAHLLACEDEAEPSPGAAERAARLLGIDPRFDLPEATPSDARSERGDAIQTLLYPELHQTVLANIADTTRAAREEQGIHTLFAAFGFVQWYERVDSDVPRFAPLVLHPLALERRRIPGAYEYTVTAHTEEPEINLAFDERLFRDFGVRLPSWEDGDDLATYFARVRAVTAGLSRFRLHRWVTLSNFSFARIAMYHDLDSERWPAAERPHLHPTFRLLMSERGRAPNSSSVTEQEPAQTRADELPTIVLDADASQAAAVTQAMQPRNLVIQGPPGTGKSQTIANLIAAALGAGQRVLFVAEKLAALEVVKARLDRAGLGAFCLELHAERATRRSVTEALGKRLSLTERPPEKLRAQRERAQALRGALNEHADALNEPAFSLGYSVHELIWRRERARQGLGQTLSALEKLSIPGAPWVRLDTLDQVRHALTGLSQAAQDRDRAFLGFLDSTWRTFLGPNPGAEPGVDELPSARTVAYANTSIEELEEEMLCRLEAYLKPLHKLGAALRRRLWPQAEQTLTLAQLSALRTLARELPKTAILDERLIERLDLRRAEQVRSALPLLREREALLRQIAPWAADPRALMTELEELRAARSALTRWTHETERGDNLSLAASEARAAERVQTSEQLLELAPRTTALAAHAGLVVQNERARAHGSPALPPAALPAKPQALEAPEAALMLRDALRMLAQTPRELLEALRAAPAICEDGALVMLEALEAQARDLRARRRASQQKLEPGSETATLRAEGAHYALALRRPWWRAWLSGRFWAARRLYARIARSPSRAAPQMADELLEATRMLEAVEQLEAREDLRRLAGRLFLGLDTDIALLIRAAQWARQVRRTHAELETGESGLESLLLHQPLERADALLAEAARLDLAPFWELAQRAQERSLPLSAALSSERQAARSALRLLTRLRQLGLSDALTPAELPALVEALDALNAVEAELKARGFPPKALGLTGTHELSADTLAAALVTFEATHTLAVPREVVKALGAPEARQAFAKPLGTPLKTEARERAALAKLGLTDDRFPALSAPLAQATAAVELALSQRTLLRAQLRYLQALARAEDTCAASVVAAAARGELPFEKLVDACEFLLFSELIERALEERTALSSRNGRELASMRRQFQTLDRRLLELQAKAIAATLSEVEVPKGVASGKKTDWSELALITHELSKRQRHIPLRQLLRRAPGALRALKPCFMMSPLTVAQFLPRETDQFDLVVIDEASQMRPEDALGSVVRAKRAVVVGDSQQLPPTHFFRRLEGHEEPFDDEQDDDGFEQESILDLGVASFGAARDLTWHYRSRHPSLIAFSNRHFYGGRLKVFPSPEPERGGVELVAVDGTYSGSRNLHEATQIALAVREHASKHPQLSLGVVAMNQPQKELIQQRLLTIDDDALRSFMDGAHPAQPFFVKNLENVQGDERDVIFVSLTYGPAPTTREVAQRFGPLNGPHGARRLNVLFTRARERLVVYSSLRAADIRVDGDKSPGVSTLRDYLAYASQRAPESMIRELRPETPFAHTLRHVLEDAGYQVESRIGVSGCFVDLAVRDPQGTGFLCGIECDGPEYHEQRSARDRERLRQEVLEHQGWTLVRIWSTDWFHAPDAARERLLRRLRTLSSSAPPRTGT